MGVYSIHSIKMDDISSITNTPIQLQTEEISSTRIQELLEKDQYNSVRLSKHTVKRLNSKGKRRESYEDIIKRLLDQDDGLHSQEELK